MTSDSENASRAEAAEHSSNLSADFGSSSETLREAPEKDEEASEHSGRRFRSELHAISLVSPRMGSENPSDPQAEDSAQPQVDTQIDEAPSGIVSPSVEAGAFEPERNPAKPTSDEDSWHPKFFTGNLALRMGDAASAADPTPRRGLESSAGGIGPVLTAPARTPDYSAPKAAPNQWRINQSDWFRLAGATIAAAVIFFGGMLAGSQLNRRADALRTIEAQQQQLRLLDQLAANLKAQYESIRVSQDETKTELAEYKRLVTEMKSEIDTNINNRFAELKEAAERKQTSTPEAQNENGPSIDKGTKAEGSGESLVPQTSTTSQADTYESSTDLNSDSATPSKKKKQSRSKKQTPTAKDD